MTRRRRRLIISLVLLSIVIALLSIAYINYRATRTIGFGLDLTPSDALAQPQFLYSFSGQAPNRLTRPLGVLVDGNNVYVTDAGAAHVDVFTRAGKQVTTFGQGHLLVPLYIARNPKTGEFWVSDRRLRSLEVFDSTGKWLHTFQPKLPKNQLPASYTKSGGIEWGPIAFAFGPDGTLYVTELVNGHRLLIFDPSGKFKRSVGTAGQVDDAKTAPDAFMFPNSVKVEGDELWVVDSNNRRIKVYNLNGDYKRMLVTSGLPRGMAFLPKRSSEPTRIVVVDTLAHDATIWQAQSGAKDLVFGAQGVLDGQFSYPNDVSTDSGRRMYIADTSNGRIQVWGWPAQANPIPTPRTPLQWLLCLSPLLLLPLLLLLRKKRFFATSDFIDTMLAAEDVHLMPGGRRRWYVTPEDYERFKNVTQGDISLSELLNEIEHSESDARALMERFELDYPTAITLSIAQRSKVFCTEDPELRRFARVIEVDVVNREEFIQRFAKSSQGTQPKTPESGAA